MGRYWIVPPVARLVSDMSTVSAEAVIPIIHAGVFQVGDELMMGKECLVIGDITAGAETIALGVSRGQRGTETRRHLAGARLSGIPHAIVATSPSGGTTWDYTVRWGKLLQGYLTTTSPGGDGELTFTVVDYDTGDGLTALPDRGSEIYVADGDGYPGRYWQGIVDEPQLLSRGRNAYEITVTARGGAILATDQVYRTSTIYAANNPIYTGMRHARDTLCPDLSTDNSHITAAVRNILVDSQNMIGRTAQEVWNQQAGLGDPDGDQILWAVLVNGTDGQWYLEIKNRPNFANYAVAKDQLERGWKLGWARGDIRNHVIVQYAGGTAEAIDAASISSLGATRMIHIDAANQIDSHGMARYAAETFLKRAKDGLATGDGFVVRWPNVITASGGGDPVDLWRIRAGEAITLSDIDPGNATLPLGDEFIRATRWDLVKHAFSWQTERLRTPANVIGHLIKQDSQRLDSSIHQAPPNAGAVVANANAAYPGVSAKTPRLGTDGRMGYSQAPQGLDKIVVLGQIGDGTGSALAGGEKVSGAVVWPAKGIKVVVRAEGEAEGIPGVVTVRWGVVTPESYPAFDTEFTPIVIDGSDPDDPYGDPEGVEFPADTKLDPGDEVKLMVDSDTPPTGTWLLKAWFYMHRSAGEEALPSDIGAPGLTSTSVGGSGVNPIINVTASEDCTAQVEFGTTTDYGAWSETSEVVGTTHAIPLRGLAAGVTYHYRLHLWDLQQNHGTSADFTFST